MKSMLEKMIGLGVVVAVAVGCGDSAYEGEPIASQDDVDLEPTSPGGAGGGADDEGVEEEEFIVRELATTSSHVFVPNSSEGSYTVARIDGRDLSVTPMRVGAQPEEIRAADVEGQGAVAYVLCEGDHTISIIRSDQPSLDGKGTGRVSLMRVPQEVNALQISPDGKYALAYIDPSKGILNADSSVASLQTMALIRLGDTEQEDQVFELSVTRQIRSVKIDASSRRAFIVGKEGVNVIELESIVEDSFVAPLRLGLSDDVYPPEDLEVDVSNDGSYFAIRSSKIMGVAMIKLSDADASLESVEVVELGEMPRDIDLLQPGDGMRDVLIVTLADQSQAVWLDTSVLIDGVEDAQDPVLERVDLSENSLFTQVAPGGDYILSYTSSLVSSDLDVFDVQQSQMNTYTLLNTIRGLAISNDGKVAVAVHYPGEALSEGGSTVQDEFRMNYGLTLVQLESGYRRPLLLEGEPADIITVENSEGEQLVYVMQQSANTRHQGVVRLSLKSFRTDFISTAKSPSQMGTVAGKLFVSQYAAEGRITFVDLVNNAQKTISGYELNARID